MKVPSKLLLIAAVMMLSGCVEELQHDLTEQDANDIMALLIDHGVGAKKAKEEGGNEVHYMVSVPRQDYANSVKLLREYSLPRPNQDGMAMFRKNKGMIPTQTEERGMWLESLGGELSNALNKVDGVLEARVIVALPEQTDLTQPDSKPKASASVFVKYRPDADGKPPISEERVRAFVVTGTTVEIDPKNVSVILTTPARRDDDDTKTKLQEVLGLTMTAASASTFKVMMGGVSLIIVALAGLLTWNFLRGGSSGGAPRRARTNA
ncbi:MAG: type III secretion protein [Myxococcaceae bacterium]